MHVLDARRTLDAVWKLESAKIIAAVSRLVHDVGIAEELAQDALVSALEQWPLTGVPDNPGAWLMTASRRRAIDHIRRSQRLEAKQAQLAHELRQQDNSEQDGGEQDDVLRLMFVSCHPVLPASDRIALTLRLLGGLTAEEIARAFLVSTTTVAQRIAGAKRALADRQVPFELPDGAELTERLSSVLEVIYLIFNEGYSATSGDDLTRPGLCLEALRIGRLLAELAPQQAEVHGLVALMEIQASRSASRIGASGEPVRLHEQNRGRWDQLLIRRGFTAMLRAREIGGVPGPYVLQAAIAVCHAQARSAEETDWVQITALYEALARLLPTPVVQLNRAVALGMTHGPQAALALVDSLADGPALQDYHLLPGVRGDLLVRLGRHDEARLEFERAASLTGNVAEQAFLRHRATTLTVTETPGITLGAAAEEFLRRGELGAATVHSYGKTLRRLCRTLGTQLPLQSLTSAQLARAFTTSWGDAAAATWNRHRAAVRSFGDWVAMEHLVQELERRAGTGTPTAAIGPVQLEALWNLPGLPLRERTLWRLLHESAAGVGAVLSLNVEHLDLSDRRARAGDTWVSWRYETSLLLPRLVEGRARGPLFVADRRPGPGRTPGPADLCPETGRRRLSYERAEYLFKRATKDLDPTGNGYTLRQLRSPAPRSRCR